MRVILKYYSHQTKMLFNYALGLSWIPVVAILAAIWVPTDFLQQRFGWSAVLLVAIDTALWVATAYSADADSRRQNELAEEYRIENGTQDRPKYRHGRRI
jgi:hypothetical protein